MLTVTFVVVAVDRVAVKVTVDAELSSNVEELEVNVTVGADSLSIMVTVVCCVPFSVAPPPETPEISTIAVSLPSYIASSVGVKVAVPVVLPAVIVISEIVP